MTATVQLALDGLTYDPPVAALDGTQTWWWCSECGANFISSASSYTDGRTKPTGPCPCCGHDAWRRSEPECGVDHVRCDQCRARVDVETGGRL